MSDDSSDSLPDDFSRSAAWLHVQVDKDSEVEMDSSEPFLPENEGFQVSRLIRHTPEGMLQSLKYDPKIRERGKAHIIHTVFGKI